MSAVTPPGDQDLQISRSDAVDPDARVVAVTGACHFLGSELLKCLEEDRRYERIIALDIKKPEFPLEKTEFHQVDLTLPTADADVTDLLRDQGVDTVVHAAFLSYPTHASEWAHELEDIGTMHVLNACAELAPARVIMLSTTMVYGASPTNPNFLSEDEKLKGHADSRYVQDKVRAEKQVLRFAAEHPTSAVCALRFAPTLGPTVTNMFTRFFSRPMAPVMMGYDPLLQFLHERDAIAALKLAVDNQVEGALNIVGKGVLPYTTVLALMGKVPIPLPHFVARQLSQALWATQVFDSPPSFLDYLRFMFVADGQRAREVLGFVAEYDIKRTIMDFLGLGSEDGAPDIYRAQG